MNKPRRWLGGISITSAAILVAGAFTAWDRVDKLIESRDFWRDRAARDEAKIERLIERADAQDLRNQSEDAWRRNSDSKTNYMKASLDLVMDHLGIKAPPGPLQEVVPRAVTRNLEVPLDPIPSFGAIP